MDLIGIEFMSSLDTAEIAAGTVIGALSGSFMLAIGALINRNKKIRNSVSKQELESGIIDAKCYTDNKIIEHEKEHRSISEIITDIKQDNVRIESKVDKILFLLAEK